MFVTQKHKQMREQTTKVVTIRLRVNIFGSVFQQGSPVSTISNFSTGSLADDFKDDPFKSKDPFGGGGGTAQADPFSNEDPFKSSKCGLF